MGPHRGVRDALQRRDLLAGQPADLEQQEAVSPSRVEPIDQLVQPLPASRTRQLLVLLRCDRGHVVELDLAGTRENVAKPCSLTMAAHDDLDDAIQPRSDVPAVELVELALHDDEYVLRE